MSHSELTDAYGLPQTELAAKNSRLAWERRWTAVLLEHNYTPTGLYDNKFSQFMGLNSVSRGLLHGTSALRLDLWRDFALRWEKVGVNPELLALILCLLPDAVDTALRDASDLSAEFALHDRLRTLNIDGGLWGSESQQLIPEQWSDFPYLLQKVGPIRALSRFLGAGRGQ
ncbi:MAG TPA: hypothetical protein DCY59_12020 [Micrococcaceae bacterium]|nr:hypothetical protein [Micrococcaceae bacterium]